LINGTSFSRESTSKTSFDEVWTSNGCSIVVRHSPYKNIENIQSKNVHI